MRISIARCISSRRAPPGAMRRRALPLPASSTLPSRPSACSPAVPPVDQSGRRGLGTRQSATWRRDHPLDPRAPLQYRALAACAAEASGAQIKVIPINDAGELDLDRLSAPALGAHAAGCRQSCLERARHHQPGEGDHRRGPCRRRAGADRRRPVGRPRPHRCAGARCRFLRLLRPQALWSDRDRRALWQACICSSDASLSGRWRHDRAGQLCWAPPMPGLPSRFEAGYAEHLRRHWALRSDRLAFESIGLEQIGAL